MTPQEALQLLDNLTAQINLSRQQHAQVAEAVSVLARTLPPEVPPHE